LRPFKHFAEHCRDARQRRFMRHGGPHHGFGRGGRLARFLEHGDLRILVLHLISEAPRHGYDLIKEVEDLTGGAYVPSPGVIYPTLTMLEELGQAASTTEGTKKLYSITEAGRAALAESKPVLDALLGRLDQMPPRENALPVLRAMENLKTALRLKASGRTVQAELLRRIADLLDETTRKIEDL
jgi:DNA-binding PadR family transcriptional regulator